MPASFTWQPGPSGGTPTNAANLNKLAVTADLGTAGTPAGDAVRAAIAASLDVAYLAPLPTVGSLTYNGDGTIASDPDGNTYTWNADGTPATQTKGGVTRTYHWNTDGTLASVS